MSEEEKKAIEWFKSDLEMTKEMGKKWGFQEEIKNNEIILNLVEKQRKEIEEKSIIIMAGAEKVKQLEKEIEDLNEIKQQICNEELITQDYVQDNFIAKCKIEEIRDKAEVMDYYSLNDVIDDLSKLIGDYKDE